MQEKNQKEPSSCLGAIFAVILLLSIYTVAYLIGYVAQINQVDPYGGILLLIIVTRICIIALATYGKYPYHRNFLTLVGITILSIIPILEWIAIYWAGLGIARIVNDN
jgi:hypothetical protein